MATIVTSEKGSVAKGAGDGRDEGRGSGDTPVAEPVMVAVEAPAAELQEAAGKGWMGKLKEYGSAVGTGIVATGRAAGKVGSAAVTETKEQLVKRRLRRLSRDQQAILDAAAEAEKAKEEGQEVGELKPRRPSFIESVKEGLVDFATITVSASSAATKEFNNQVAEHKIVEKLEEMGLKKRDVSSDTVKCRTGECGICKTCTGEAEVTARVETTKPATPVEGDAL